MENLNKINGGNIRAIQEKEQAKQRIINYNKNPNVCKYCKTPIIAPFDKKLKDTLNKKFCNRSCSAKYNNKGNIKNLKGVNGVSPIINNFTNDEIIKMYNDSKSLTDFSLKLGYKQRIKSDNISVINKLNELNLDLSQLRYKNRYNNGKTNVSEYTKGFLFSLRADWNIARSTIQSMARKTFENSNKPKYCLICGYNKHYEVAHIKSVSSFNNDASISEINNINNLIGLCPNHHWEYDNNGLDISNYLNDEEIIYYNSNK